VTLTIAYSKFSAPSAQRIAEQGEVDLVRSSTAEVDVNWGRASAAASLNADTSNATNKRVMRELFAQHGVPMPTLFTPQEVVQQVMTHLAAGETLPPLIGRPDRHSKGRGLWLVTSAQDFDRALRGTRKKRAATHFMEYISKERAPHEYRVHIFQGRSIRISRKDYGEDKVWKAVKPGDVDLRAVRSAAKAAVAALGLDFGAVDVLCSAEHDQAWVLEVNSAPGLGGTMPRVYFETFTRWKEGHDG